MKEQGAFGVDIPDMKQRPSKECRTRVNDNCGNKNSCKDRNCHQK